MKERICIIGTGMAGLGAAHRFHQAGLPTVSFEKRPYYGGHTASHKFAEGFLFDEGPHISFTKNERLQELFADSVGGEFECLQTKVNNYWKGHWIKHPAQTNLYGLPTELITSIIEDFVAVQNKPIGNIRNYADWLEASYGETFRSNLSGRVHDQVSHHRAREYEHRLDRTADVSTLPGGGFTRSSKAPAAEEVHYITDFRYPKRGGFVQFLNKFIRQTEI